MGCPVLFGSLAGRSSITELLAKDFFNRFIPLRNLKLPLISGALNGLPLPFFCLALEFFCPHCASCPSSCSAALCALRCHTWCELRSSRNSIRSTHACL